MNAEPEQILEYWFGAADCAEPTSSDLKSCIGRWFESGGDIDAEVKRRFAGELEQAAVGARDHWAETPRGLLALIVVLDQLARNIHRGSPRAFAFDSKTLALSQRADERGDERHINLVHRIVLHLPLMHSESMEIQRVSLVKYRGLYDESSDELRGQMINVRRAAERHYEIIERFGRYPHRNAVLGRPMTSAETAFLKEPNSSF